MVGSEVLKAALTSDQVSEILSVGRRPSEKTHSKLRKIEHSNFLDFSSIRDHLKNMDIAYYCLGVYQGKTPKDEFWKVTVDYQEALVKELESVSSGITFCLFSAQGADRKERSPIRFARAKGRAEKLLLESDLKEKYIFRPGFINPDNGARTDIWSKFFQPLFKLFPSIGVDATRLGRVIFQVGLQGSKKVTFENKDILKFDLSTESMMAN